MIDYHLMKIIILMEEWCRSFQIKREIDEVEPAWVMEHLKNGKYKHTTFEFVWRRNVRRMRLIKNVTNSSHINIQKCYIYRKFINELKNSLNRLKKKIFNNVKDSIYRSFNDHYSNDYIKTLKMKNKETRTNNDQVVSVNMKK